MCVADQYVSAMYLFWTHTVTKPKTRRNCSNDYRVILPTMLLLLTLICYSILWPGMVGSFFSQWEEYIRRAVGMVSKRNFIRKYKIYFGPLPFSTEL